MPGGYPAPLGDLYLNLSEVRRLIDIHTELTGDKRGRRRNVDVLNKSGIVLLVACWEAFVEDAAKASFAHLLRYAPSPDAVPGKVLALAAAPIQRSPDARQVFSVAGDGWRTALQQHADTTLSQFVDGFNTPRPEKIDKLYEDLIGLKALSSQWRWHKNYNSRVKDRLNELITLRGQIAHRVSVDRYVKKREVLDAGELIANMAVITSNCIHSHLKSCVAEIPWAQVTVGGKK